MRWELYEGDPQGHTAAWDLADGSLMVLEHMLFSLFCQERSMGGIRSSGLGRGSKDRKTPRGRAV